MQSIWRSGLLIFLTVALSLAACEDVRPVAKIGLIAPFEGLYRRTGYEALAAMRQAIAEASPHDIAIIPLALDDSATSERAQRAAQKLRVDPQVRAIVGPLTPALTAVVADVLGGADVPWIVPYAVNPEGGFASPFRSTAWAEGLIAAAGAAVQRQGATALAVAGDASGWPVWDEVRWSALAGLPTRFLHDDGASLQPHEAIFWLGAADEAAAFLNAMPELGFDLPFWLGPAGGDPVLAERLQIDSKLYWLTWSNLYYIDQEGETDRWMPSTWLVYEATHVALGAVTGTGAVSAPSWHIEMFVLEDGVSQPLTFDEYDE
jgi:hypothetical protein